MSNDNLKAALRKLGQQYITELAQLLRQRGKDVTGNLISSLNFDVIDNGEQIELDIHSDSYLEEVDQGRRPGKAPPVKAILPWVKKKNLKFGKTDEETAFIIARKIGRFGTKGVNVVSEAQNKTLDAMTQELLDAAAKDTLDLIDKELTEFKP